MQYLGTGFISRRRKIKQIIPGARWREIVLGEFISALIPVIWGNWTLGLLPHHNNSSNYVSFPSQWVWMLRCYLLAACVPAYNQQAGSADQVSPRVPDSGEGERSHPPVRPTGEMVWGEATSPGTDPPESDAARPRAATGCWGWKEMSASPA